MDRIFPRLKITVLVENRTDKSRTVAEHGLALWCEYGETRILFDTGQGTAFGINAAALGIDLSKTDMLVLSHGHYDHTGGIALVRDLAPKCRLYVHKEAFCERYSLHADNSLHSIGTPLPDSSEDINFNSSAAKIAPGVFLSGSIPRINDFEDAGGRFFKDEKCLVPDQVFDDQALFFETARGLVLLTGCAHAGIINITRHAAKIFGGQKIHAIIGGLHLVNACSRRLELTVQALEKLSFDYLYPAHCTSENGCFRLREQFPARFRHCHVGTVIEVPPQ